MKNLYVIDAYNLIYRMFYAVPEMHTRDGQIVNAVFGVVKFIKSLAEMSPNDTILVASESGSNFRETLFSEYKGTRDRMPDNLRSQITLIFEFFEATGIPVLVREGYEADDIIGSIVFDPDGYDEVVIISSDKDLCQFIVDGKVRIFDAMKQKNMKRTDVIDKFGVPPEQVVDYLSIVGDSSDNIPGIAGFGPKKAVDLLSKYNTLQGIYEELGIMNYELGTEVHIDEEKYNTCELTEKTKQTLIDQIHNAFLSQKLASIVTTLDIPLEEIVGIDSSLIFQSSRVIDYLKKYEFKSLIPAGQREVRKEISKGEMREVVSQDDLDTIFEHFQQVGAIYLATKNDGTVALGVRDTTYLLDTRRVDATDFFDRLLDAPSGKIIGYDLKEDIKRLLVGKNPLQNGEGQGSLF